MLWLDRGLAAQSRCEIKPPSQGNVCGRVLRLNHRCRWIQGDVTDSGLWDRLGYFDLVICSGLLYHLDAGDLIPLLQHINTSCKKRGMSLIDTNIAPAPLTSVELPGQPRLWGCHWEEHQPGTNEEERLAAGWSSYLNNQAFWLTERSLTNAIVSAGFGTVLKPLYPYHEWGHQTRDVWIALPGQTNPAGLALREDPDPRPWKHPGLK